MQIILVHRFSRFLPRLANGIMKTTHFKISMQMTKLNSIRSLCSKSEENSTIQDPKISSTNMTWRPIYHMPKISFARIIHRLKLYQSLFTISVLPVCFSFYYLGKTDITTTLIITGVASFTSISLYVFSSFFKRLIGIIFIDKDQKHLKIAHLTFWGSRKDIIVPIDEIIPLTDCDCDLSDAFVKIHRTNSDEYLYMTLRFGRILDKDTFEKVFGSFEILKSK